MGKNRDIEYVKSNLYALVERDDLTDEWRWHFYDLYRRLCWGVASLQDAADALDDFEQRASEFGGDYMGRWDD